VCLNFLFVFALTFPQESPHLIPHFPSFKYILSGVTRVDDPVASIDLCQTAEDVAIKKKCGKKRKVEDTDEEEEEVRGEDASLEKPKVGGCRAATALTQPCLHWMLWWRRVSLHLQAALTRTCVL
jgi:hypothetical protein